MCGNDIGVPYRKIAEKGSPPLVRERPLTRFTSSSANRITPACAGTTRIHCCRMRTTRDHPRLCGNDPRRMACVASISGSPPLVRERPRSMVSGSSGSGITPACAGTTRLSSAGFPTFEDHPRLCGNDRSAYDSIFCRLGSPPLVRERLGWLSPAG